MGVISWQAAFILLILGLIEWFLFRVWFKLGTFELASKLRVEVYEAADYLGVPNHKVEEYLRRRFPASSPKS